MSTVIAVDFKRRMVRDIPLSELTQERQEPTMFEYHDQMVSNICARHNEEPLEQGYVYKQSMKSSMFDTYGYGNVHNSLHQYSGGKYFNSPYPMPADLKAIDKFLNKNSGRVVGLGDKSDPFMWMDQKYQITKSVLILANKYKVTLFIETMSDLCAHDEYLKLLSEGDHTIQMIMGFEETKAKLIKSRYGREMEESSEQIEKAVSPGAPSLRRRQKAIEKLNCCGVNVITKNPSLKTLNLKQKQEFCRRTGTTVDSWLRDKK